MGSRLKRMMSQFHFNKSNNLILRVFLTPIVVLFFQFVIPASASPINFYQSHHTVTSETYAYDETESSAHVEVSLTGGLSRVLSVKGVRLDHEILVEASSVAVRSSTKLSTRFVSTADNVVHDLKPTFHSTFRALYQFLPLLKKHRSAAC
ncbi:hypothetical protein SAMN05421747_1273 [Parapedobacter composti]|uniref:Uncharacterized protein n=1 Tax=Parapedobacter composti TaxID=623281 RepID=A0A1I1M6S0_9SPHI|nr:hypothetical protein SAMN05421747_1273 [Parapedobacter composti]